MFAAFQNELLLMNFITKSGSLSEIVLISSILRIVQELG